MANSIPAVFPGNPHFLAAELKKCANGDGPENWRILPYRVGTDDTTWWVRRGTDNPAYRHYKAVIRPVVESDQPVELWIGTNAEKGLGADFAAMASTKKQKNLVMDDSWEWPRFESLLGKGVFGPIAEGVKKAGLEPLLTVSVGMVGPSPNLDDTFKDDMPGAKNTFRIEASSLHRIGRGGSHPKLPEADGIPTSTSWTSLGEALKPVVKHPWTWIDVYLYARFEPGQAGAAWGPERLWQELVTPFLKPLR